MGFGARRPFSRSGSHGQRLPACRPEPSVQRNNAAARPRLPRWQLATPCGRAGAPGARALGSAGTRPATRRAIDHRWRWASSIWVRSTSAAAATNRRTPGPMSISAASSVSEADCGEDRLFDPQRRRATVISATVLTMAVGEATRAGDRSSTDLPARADLHTRHAGRARRLQTSRIESTILTHGTSRDQARALDPYT